MDRRRSPGLGVFSGEGGSKHITTYLVQVRHTLAWMFGENILRAIGCDEKVELLCKLAMPRLSSGV